MWNKDKLLDELAQKLVENIAGLMDEYTIYFAIASYFLLVIVLSVFGNVISIINEHVRSLFKLISKLFGGGE